MVLDFLLPQHTLLLVSFAGSSSYYGHALGLSSQASCFLCTHTLVISFSLLPTKTIYRLMAYISILDPSPECQTPILDFILDLSMWTSNRHLKLTMSQMEPPILPSNLLYPQLSSLYRQRMANSVLLSCKDSTWSQSQLFFFSHVPHIASLLGSSLFSIFKIHPESDFSPPSLLPPCFEPPSFFT